MDRSRRRDARRGRVPAPPAHGVAAARGRDARALRRPRLAPRRRRARHARPGRRAAPLPRRVGRRPPRARPRRAAARVRRLRAREPSARRDPRPAARGTEGRACRDGARRPELAVPLPRGVRPDVQPLPALLARVHARPARGSGARRSASMGAVGGHGAARRGDPPVRRAAARRPGGVRPRVRAAPAPRGDRRRSFGARARDPVLAHRPRPRRPVRRRRRGRRGEARGAVGRRALPLALRRRRDRRLVAGDARGPRGGRGRDRAPAAPGTRR